MNLLLDTHALLWFISNDPNLSDHARDLIENGQNDLYVSTASLWEIAIKISIGKMTLQGDFETLIPSQLQQNRIETLEIGFPHLVKVATLP